VTAAGFEKESVMTLAYGYVKTKVTSEPKLKPSHHGHETQYHLHCNLSVDGGTWDVAVNVGANTGKWRDSDVMDGSDAVEPAGSLKRLLSRARQNNLDVYIFGCFYSQGGGLHDVHLNQGSTKSFVHRPGDDSNDHNDIWQDGAVLVDVGEAEWAAYFSAFNQQLVPTDDLGNPLPGGTTI
jgi:hypothetical protein